MKKFIIEMYAKSSYEFEVEDEDVEENEKPNIDPYDYAQDLANDIAYGNAHIDYEIKEVK